MKNETRFLEFEGIQIAAFIESDLQDEHTGYHPNNILIYVEQGKLNIREKQQLHIISKGNFCLVRKFSNISYFKTKAKNEKSAIVKAMVLQDDFVKEAIAELRLDSPLKPIKGNIINLKKNGILLGLYDSLMVYIDENEEPDKQIMFLKTKEALLGMLKADPEILAIFYEFAKPVKAELQAFMEHHAISNVPLKVLAKLSGRSLSTFNRDFKDIYKCSPHKWILQRRLQKAKELLLITNKKSSQIYLELGFKDLAHFSKSFKNEFGKTPTEITRI